MLSVLNEENLKRVLNRMLDEKQFLGPHGIRSISREHLEKPYTFDLEELALRCNTSRLSRRRGYLEGTRTGAVRYGCR